MTEQAYRWRVGDVFTDGKYEWRVDSIYGEKAVLRSCGSSWATTVPLTLTEWHKDGLWKLKLGSEAPHTPQEDRPYE